MATGVYFHDKFLDNNWPIIGNRYIGFPTMLQTITAKSPAMQLIEPQPVSLKLLEKVHTPQYLSQVKQQWYYQEAMLSVGAAVDASMKVWEGDLKNAVVFNVAAGHHASPDSAWGGTYLSMIGPVLHQLRKNGLQRLAYLDTDAHHGDGSRNVLKDEQDILHICFCSDDYFNEENTMICKSVPYQCLDQEYLEMVQQTFDRVRDFKPHILCHFFGHDTHADDYGSRGLSEQFFIDLAIEVKDLAKEICANRLVLFDGGGANREVGLRIWPSIINELTQE